jgi:hypothetical protein
VVDADVVCDFLEFDLDPLPPQAAAPSESRTVLRATATAHFRIEERRKNGQVSTRREHHSGEP